MNTSEFKITFHRPQDLRPKHGTRCLCVNRHLRAYEFYDYDEVRDAWCLHDFVKEDIGEEFVPYNSDAVLLWAYLPVTVLVPVRLNGREVIEKDLPIIKYENE